MNAPTDNELALLSVRVGAALVERGLKAATAESCTGGYVAKLLTDVPGSSAWFDCGFVSYSNASKRQVLGVSGETLRQEGAVSEKPVRLGRRDAKRRAPDRGGNVVPPCRGGNLVT